ncbi:MAG: glycosyltransferase family 4 protein [Candidatus Magasanikbacteria bacterium]|nr:glycosyltransferase family 4 protein [Candidatus Magasanikbacteria bacterium]MCA9389573.1 glycosyltransferase family 4 protein [Candidatus Magasanikbacteria bacterium]MCA9391474.1 glycosyltransferase family 4 protein [Candidatus Magasanikbacteria bacterium]USN52691.1 MAG: glycosyltransferase family 4 protein [Candidatus Nomurabacteria bacterium]
MKKVLIFSTAYFPLVGGAEVAMKEITDRLHEWEFHVITAKIQPGLARTERFGNAIVHRCGFGMPVDKYLLPCFGVWRALRIAKKEEVQVIWSLMASYGGFAALVYTWVRPKAKMLLTLQEGDPLDYIAKRVGIFHRFFVKIFERANAVQAISHFLADWAVKMGFKGVPIVIPNGVDIARFTAPQDTSALSALRTQWGVSQEDILVVTASRLVLKNGTDDLIRALTFLPKNYKLIIAGDGDDRDKLRVLTQQKQLTERVVFLGGLSHEKLPSVLKACDIFCRPSLSEGLGISFLEAMAVGLPIIGTPVGGIPDFLQDGETGVFCQPRDPESIAKAVLRIQNVPGLRDTLIVRGSALVSESYNWENIAEDIGKMIRSI